MSTPESWRISSRSLEVLRVTPSSYSPSSSSSALEPLPFVTLSKIERGRSFLPTSAISLFDYICRADHIFTGSLRACVCLAITHETVVVTGFWMIFNNVSSISSLDFDEILTNLILLSLQYCVLILSFIILCLNASSPPKYSTGL